MYRWKVSSAQDLYYLCALRLEADYARIFIKQCELLVNYLDSEDVPRNLLQFTLFRVNEGSFIIPCFFEQQRIDLQTLSVFCHKVQTLIKSGRDPLMSVSFDFRVKM